MKYLPKILIVDDLFENLYILENFLVDLDCEIVKCTNGEEAIAESDKYEFALAIFDVQMPNMNGYELAENFRQKEKFRNLPIIFLSAVYSDDFHIFKGYESGAVDFITKPFNPEILVSKARIFVQLDIQKHELQIANKKLNNEIKERKSIEIALRESEVKLLEAQGVAKIGSLENDLVTGQIKFSNNLFRLLDIDESDQRSFIGFYFDLNNPYIHQEDRRRVIQTYETSLKLRKSDLSLSFRIIDSKTNLKHVNFVLSITYDKDGTPLLLKATFQDITQSMLNEQLKQEYAIAEQTAKIKQQLLANMSHELRTPITGIVGMVDFLLETKLDEKQLDYTQIIKSSVDGLLNIINDILLLSKIEAGTLRIISQDFSFEKILKDTRTLFESLSKKKNIKLKTNYHKDLPEIICTDQNRLKQIIFNLVSNAVKFTDKGKVTINVLPEKERENSLTIRVEVIDTGIGIPEDKLGVLFMKFSQIDPSVVRDYEGMGLGLAISKEIVELLYGEIGVESIEGEGSTFWFTFVAQKSESEDCLIKEKGCTEDPDEKESSIDSEDLDMNILLVDDKFVVRKVVGMMLEAANCKVDYAENGIEALDAYQDGKYDAILMDIQMPKMDGVTVNNILKKKFKDVPPIVGLSANALEGDAEYYIMSGLDDYLSKPVTKEVLYSKLKSLKSNSNDRTYVPTKTEENVIKNLNEIPVLNEDTFDIILKQTSCNKEIIQEIFDSFFRDSDELLDTIDACLYDKNFEKMESSIHTLKGLFGTIGASQIHKIAKLADQYLKESMIVSAKKLLPLLSAKYVTFREKVISRISQIEPN